MNDQIPRFCGNCKFWRPDMRPGEKMAWGYCTVGLPEGTTMSNRTTTDLACCTSHDYLTAKDVAAQ
jgi:hypothetical protein